MEGSAFPGLFLVSPALPSRMRKTPFQNLRGDPWGGEDKIRKT